MQICTQAVEELSIIVHEEDAIEAILRTRPE
jgi:hypothetical protein